jgi:hypothetical protein
MKQKADEFKRSDPNASFEAGLKARMAAFGGEEALPWIYRNNIEEVWENFLQEQSKPNGLQ